MHILNLTHKHTTVRVSETKHNIYAQPCTHPDQGDLCDPPAIALISHPTP